MNYLALGAMLAGAAVLAQDTPARFRADVRLVEVYATVTDQAGAPVTGLGPDDFVVFEDGVRQTVSTFAAGEFPLTVALGVDRSSSMAGERLRMAKQASSTFLGALGPTDRSMVMAIGSDAEVVADLSSDRPAQIRAIETLDAWSTTALYDAVAAALDRLEPESGRRALVIFSDGLDRYSRTTPASIVERARRSGVLVYPVMVGREQVPVMTELATLTGGRSFRLRDLSGLDATLSRIAQELRHQYLLGYVPEAQAPATAPEWRAIRVALASTASGLRVRARDGYYTD